MTESERGRVHPDVLQSEEHIPSSQKEISVNGNFEEDFDFYKYLDAFKQETRDYGFLSRNLKLQVIVAILLENKDVSVKKLEHTFEMSQTAIWKNIYRTANIEWDTSHDDDIVAWNEEGSILGERARNQFVEKYTDEATLAHVKMTPPVRQLLRTIAMRLSLQTRNL